ncbi:MAG: MAPEG family protein, partial [Pseudomonadota bacterium]|nr:MAPEG family protein [Pseudomonadota bacterium]
MEAAQTSALALYVGLNLLLTFLLALNVVRHRFKGDSVDQVKLEKAVRAHGNNTEYVPIILIGLGVMTMTGASAQTI